MTPAAFWADRAVKIPDAEHFAIIENKTIYDGEGGSCLVVEYHVFLDQELWLTEVRRLAQAKPLSEFKAMHVAPASIKIDVKVKKP